MRKVLFFIVLILLCVSYFYLKPQKEGEPNLPLVAIANYGPHASLSAAITGFKKEMASSGFVEGKNIRYKMADVNFSQHLISQMLLGLSASKPKAMLVLTTPVAETAKRLLPHLPLVYTVVTNPVEAGLLKEKYQANANMTGSSDNQNLKVFLNEAKRLLPNAKTVGLLYATGESNDLALVKKMKKAAQALNMKMLAVAVDEARDIPLRMSMFKHKADFIYVGASGPVQPSLPVISSIAKKMNIPVFNVERDAVVKGLALASMGVDYEKVGENAGALMTKVLQGKPVNTLPPSYPHSKDLHRVINVDLARQLGIHIPTDFVEVGHD